MILQDAVDLAHEIREHYPQLTAYINQTGSNNPEHAAYVWISREVQENWYECQNITCVLSVREIDMEVKRAQIFGGLVKHD